MVECCEKVLTYTDRLNKSGFIQQGLTYDATIRNLELIGEAATHVPIDIREIHPDVAWRQVIATRNVLIHGYLGIDNDILWSIIKDDVPALHMVLLGINQMGSRNYGK